MFPVRCSGIVDIYIGVGCWGYAWLVLLLLVLFCKALCIEPSFRRCPFPLVFRAHCLAVWHEVYFLVIALTLFWGRLDVVQVGGIRGYEQKSSLRAALLLLRWGVVVYTGGFTYLSAGRPGW